MDLVHNSNLTVVKRREVPVYLRSGEFFKSLHNDSDEEEISVPNKTLKPNTAVANRGDLEELLLSLRFWGVDEIFEEVILFSLSNDGPECLDVLNLFRAHFPYIGALLKVMETHNNKEKLLQAIKFGNLEIVRAVVSSNLTNCGTFGCNSADGCRYAAQFAHVNILQYFHEQNGCIPDEVLPLALQAGSICCIEYCRNHGIAWPDNALVRSLQGSRLNIFHYALQQGCTWHNKTDLLLDKYIDGLTYALRYGYPCNAEAAVVAAGNGSLRCLQVLHEHGCTWSTQACSSAAIHGYAECLQFLHESGCPWDENTVLCSVLIGNLPILRFAIERHCPYPANICSQVVQHGNLPMLQYLHEAGVHWSSQVCTAAARSRQLECLKYAHEQGCAWDASTTTEAARHGSLRCLQYAVERGCPLTIQALKVSRSSHQREVVSCAKYVALKLSSSIRF